MAIVLWAAPLFGHSLLVFAAASLADALGQASAVYQRKTGQKVEFSFEASSLLAMQIAKGAPADLFASADEAQMDQLAFRGLILQGTRRDLLSNSLVAVARADSPLAVSSAAGLESPEVGRLALADPRMVPAGVYARAYLRSQGLWAALASKVLPTGNVRGALQAVVSGNADVAMVYKTDAEISKDVRVLFEVPATQGPRIAYPFAVLAASAQKGAARRFLDWLASPAGLALFRSYGFFPLKRGG